MFAPTQLLVTTRIDKKRQDGTKFRYSLLGIRLPSGNVGHFISAYSANSRGETFAISPMLGTDQDEAVRIFHCITEAADAVYPVHLVDVTMDLLLDMRCTGKVSERPVSAPANVKKIEAVGN